MKKLVLLLALFLIAGLCFAQYDNNEDVEEEYVPPKIEFLNVELSIGVPVHWTTSEAPHIDFYDGKNNGMDRTVTASTSIGFAVNMNITRRFGFVIDFDVFVGSDVMGNTPTDSYSHSLFGMNALVGPVIYLYNGTFLRIPLALGLHLYYWSADHWDFLTINGDEGTWLKTQDFQLGPGLYLGIQFHFNRNMYIFSRTNVAIDMYRNHRATGRGYNADTDSYQDINVQHKDPVMEFGWKIKPAVGIGVKF